MSISTVLIVSRAGSVRALLRRAVSRPAIGLGCKGAVGTLSSARRILSKENPGALILDPDDLPAGEVENFIRKFLGSGGRILLLDSPASSLPALPENQVRRVPKPRTPREWEELCFHIPGNLHQEEGRVVLSTGIRFLAIGASAGGPGAIDELLEALGDSLKKMAVVIVQHIGPGFEEGFASWLQGKYPFLDVGVLVDAERVGPGKLRIAGPGRHLLLDARGFVRSDKKGKAVNGHRPSIDVFFESLARWEEVSSVAAVLLSGMGRDGAAGLKRLHEAGALTLVQNPESSVVFGMPRVALESGAAEHVLSPAGIALILRNILDEEIS